MAYTNRTIRLAFDGSDDKLPNLGDDIWVVIANPMLMPPSKLRPRVDVELTPDGKPADLNAAIQSTMEIVAGLIVDWSVYDALDFSDSPEKIPLPATTERMDQLPMAITNAISEIMGKALNPQ